MFHARNIKRVFLKRTASSQVSSKTYSFIPILVFMSLTNLLYISQNFTVLYCVIRHCVNILLIYDTGRHNKFFFRSGSQKEMFFISYSMLTSFWCFFFCFYIIVSLGTKLINYFGAMQLIQPRVLLIMVQGYNNKNRW